MATITRPVIKCLAILITAFIFTIFSCHTNPVKEKRRKEHSTLKIIIDTASNFYLDAPSISANHAVKGFTEQTYDSVNKTDVFIFDSVENGELIINLSSLFPRSFSKELLLKGDTTIFFSKSELPNFQNGNSDSLNFHDLEPGEKIFIGHTSSGCFHYYTEETVIQRKDNAYLVEYSSNRPSSDYSNRPIKVAKQFDKTFSEPLSEFFYSLQKFWKKKLYGLCTTTDTYFINRENENMVYVIHDGTCANEITYYNIVSWINSR